MSSFLILSLKITYTEHSTFLYMLTFLKFSGENPQKSDSFKTVNCMRKHTTIIRYYFKFHWDLWGFENITKFPEGCQTCFDSSNDLSCLILFLKVIWCPRYIYVVDSSAVFKSWIFIINYDCTLTTVLAHMKLWVKLSNVILIYVLMYVCLQR